MLAADTYPRQPGIDALHYIFRITLSDDTDEITGEATIELRFLNDHVTEFALDLTSAFKGEGNDCDGGHFRRIASPVHASIDRLTITLSVRATVNEKRRLRSAIMACRAAVCASERINTGAYLLQHQLAG